MREPRYTPIESWTCEARSRDHEQSDSEPLIAEPGSQPPRWLSDPAGDYAAEIEADRREEARRQLARSEIQQRKKPAA